MNEGIYKAKILSDEIAVDEFFLFYDYDSEGLDNGIPIQANAKIVAFLINILST